MGLCWWTFQLKIMCCIAIIIMISITSVIQYIHKYKTPADSVVSHTNGFINFLASVHGDTRRETQFLLCWPHPNARCILWYLRSLSIEIQKTQLHLSAVKIQLSSQWSNLNWLFSNSSNSQDHFFWAWRHPLSSPVSCQGVNYDKWWLSYPLHASVRLHQMTMHLD